MTTPHPHADATYRIVPLDDNRFGVEVLIPESYPTMVTGLDSREAAEAWIVGHKARVAAHATAPRGWRASRNKGKT